MKQRIFRFHCHLSIVKLESPALLIESEVWTWNFMMVLFSWRPSFDPHFFLPAHNINLQWVVREEIFIVYLASKNPIFLSNTIPSNFNMNIHKIK